MQKTSMVLKIFRGLFGPKLPRKLRKPETANAWGMRFSDRWVDTHEKLSRRYGLLRGELPAITSHYLKRKIELGNRLGQAGGREWKEAAKKAFDEIREMRKEALYPVAMLPFQAFKAEKRGGSIQKAASVLSKTLISSTSAYGKMLKSVESEEKRLRDMHNSLGKFRKALLSPQAREELGSLTGGKAVQVGKLLSDLESMDRHMVEAKWYLGNVRKGIVDKKELAAMAERRTRLRRP